MLRSFDTRQTRRVAPAVVFLLLAATFPLQAAESETAGDERLNALVSSFYEPSGAEAVLLAGSSREAFEGHGERAIVFAKRLEGEIDRSALQLADRVDYDFFQAQLDNSTLHLTDLRRWETDPTMYLPFNEFFAPLLDKKRPFPERFDSAVEGLERAPETFLAGQENLTRPPRLWTEKAIAACAGVRQYFADTLPALLAEAPSAEAASRLQSAVGRYREHLDRYQEFLENDLLPRSDGSFAVGEERFERLLRNYFLDYSVDELIEIGTRLHADTVATMERVARDIDPTKTWRELLDENMMDHPAPWRLFSALGAEAARARELVYTRMVNVPKELSEKYVYVEGGHWETLRRGASGIGPFVFVGERYVGYYVLPSIDRYEGFERQNELMLDWSRAWFIAQQIPHEVYPGHHFQLFMASHNTRPARRLVGNAPFTDVSASFTEGFAVYAEEAMYDLGYFQNDARLYLAHLAHRLWRIVRVRADPLMHARGASYDDVHRMFMEAGLTEGQAHVEASQITMLPVHDVCYSIGKREVLALREEYRREAGDRFDYKDFHTELLLLGGTPTKLAREEMLAGLAPQVEAADDREIVFHSDRDGNTEIYAIRADGSGEARLTEHSAYDGFPSWSPDGREILFQSDRDGGIAVHIMAADGSDVRRIPGTEGGNYPKWSRDGGRIAFFAERRGNTEIWTIRPDGSDLRNVTRHPAIDETPSWSADGSLMAFQSDRAWTASGGNSDDRIFSLFVMGPDGTVPMQVTSGSTNDENPAIHPAGDRIVYQSYIDDGLAIAVIDLESRRKRVLTEPLPPSGSPAWSGDGSRIVFDSSRDGNFEIFVMKADGTAQTQLTFTDGDVENSGASWRLQ